jgi:YidC/Oxa1 family membrane protein insertase
MDTKRLIVAVAISIVILVIYQMFFMPKPSPQPPVDASAQGQAVEVSKETPESAQTAVGEKSTGTRDLGDLTTQPRIESQPAEQKSLEAVSENLKGLEARDVTVETDLFIAVFTNEGAGLKSFMLKKYLDDKGQPLDLVSKKVFETLGKSDDIALPYPFYFSTFGEDAGNKETFKMLNREKFLYDGPPTVTLSGGETGEIVFKYKDVERNLSVYKRFIFANGSYIVGLDYELIKDGIKLSNVPFIFGPDLENNISEARGIQSGLKISAYNGSKSTEWEFLKTKTVKTLDETIEKADGTLGSNFLWAAYDRAYFTAIFKISPKNSFVSYSVYKEIISTMEGEGKDKKEKKKTEFYSFMVVTNPELVYLGPKDEDVLDTVKDVILNADKVISYGFLGGVAKILLKGINFTHGFIPNYGWAIVVFTIFLKVLLFPLTYTSSVSMAKMQALQPKIKAIKKKYKNMRDPEQRKKMNMETMELYKREKVNPASGCLPMLLQLPILFAFFSLLRTSINVRHEAWIFWITDLSLKDPIYLLPILMGATQILLQKMSPTSAEGTQQKMMYIMPIFITFIVINLPSGLTLHWLTSNLLQIGQQVIINKKIYQEKKDEEKELKALKRKKGGKGK